MDLSLSMIVLFKVIRNVFIKHKQNFRCHLGDYEKHIFSFFHFKFLGSRFVQQIYPPEKSRVFFCRLIVKALNLIEIHFRLRKCTSCHLFIFKASLSILMIWQKNNFYVMCSLKWEVLPQIYPPEKKVVFFCR